MAQLSHDQYTCNGCKCSWASSRHCIALVPCYLPRVPCEQQADVYAQRYVYLSHCSKQYGVSMQQLQRRPHLVCVGCGSVKCRWCSSDELGASIGEQLLIRALTATPHHLCDLVTIPGKAQRSVTTHLGQERPHTDICLVRMDSTAAACREREQVTSD